MLFYIVNIISAISMISMFIVMILENFDIVKRDLTKPFQLFTIISLISLLIQFLFIQEIL